MKARAVTLSPRWQIATWIFFFCILSLIFLIANDPNILPRTINFTIIRNFFTRALSPAFSYEAEIVPTHIEPILFKALRASANTVMFAGAGLSIALIFGLGLSLVCSRSWWGQFNLSSKFHTVHTSKRSTSNSVHEISADHSKVHYLSWPKSFLLFIGRSFACVIRSIHEILWAILFLSAFGFTHLAAALAIGIPYAGVFAKVFSELFDETDHRARLALEYSGAKRSSAFLFAVLPQTLPDLIAYSLYRFECGLRSSAILGFFGFPTLGYFISASFENLYYGEVWTYLYFLVALIVLVDLWSRCIRKRLAT